MGGKDTTHRGHHMAVASAISYTATGGAVPVSGVTSNASGTAGIEVDVDVAASTTNQLYTIAIDVSELKSLFLVTDGGMTIKTNSSGSPDDTFTMVAYMPLIWVDGYPTANPLGTDVTKLYLTTGSGSTVNLSGFINQDI